MDSKVVLTPQSTDDLKEAVIFIAPHNPERVRTFGNELIKQTENRLLNRRQGISPLFLIRWVLQ
jgi:hypothetical protein